MRLVRFCATALLAVLLLLVSPPVAPCIDITFSIDVPSGQIRTLGGGSDCGLSNILRQNTLSHSTALDVFAPIQLKANKSIGINATAVDDDITIGPNALLATPADMAQYPSSLITTERGISGQVVRIAFALGARLYIPNAKMGERYTMFVRKLQIEATEGYQLDLPASIIADSPFFIPDWEVSPGYTLALSFNPAFIDAIDPRISAASQVFLRDALQKDIIAQAHVNDVAGGVRLLSSPAPLTGALWAMTPTPWPTPCKTCRT